MIIHSAGNTYVGFVVDVDADARPFAQVCDILKRAQLQAESVTGLANEIRTKYAQFVRRVHPGEVWGSTALASTEVGHPTRDVRQHAGGANGFMTRWAELELGAQNVKLIGKPRAARDLGLEIKIHAYDGNGKLVNSKLVRSKQYRAPSLSSLRVNAGDGFLYSQPSKCKNRMAHLTKARGGLVAARYHGESQHIPKNDPLWKDMIDASHIMILKFDVADQLAFAWGARPYGHPWRATTLKHLDGIGRDLGTRLAAYGNQLDQSRLIVYVFKTWAALGVPGKVDWIEVRIPKGFFYLSCSHFWGSLIDSSLKDGIHVPDTSQRLQTWADQALLRGRR